MLMLKAAGVALNQTPFDWKGNHRRILMALEEARQQGASIVCLPELCITGYGCEDAFFNPHLQESALRELFEIAPKTRGLVVGIGLPVRHKGVLFNCTALLVDGKVRGFVPKKALAGDGVHYEPRWFKAWHADRVSEIEISGNVFPFGSILLTC